MLVIALLTDLSESWAGAKIVFLSVLFRNHWKLIASRNHKWGIAHTNGKHTFIPTFYCAYPPDAFEQQTFPSIHGIELSLIDRPITQYPSLWPRHFHQRETQEFRQMTPPSFQQLVGSPGIYTPASAYKRSCSMYISTDIPTRMHSPLVHPHPGNTSTTRPRSMANDRENRSGRASDNCLLRILFRQ